MGIVREKHIRTSRRARSAKPESVNLGSVNTNDNVDDSKVGTKPKNSSSAFEDNGWGYCSEEQLEEIMLENLEFLYNEAINKLVSFGYDEEMALKAILRNGHCCGGMDVLTNILHYSLAYLNSGGSNERDSDEPSPLFENLRQLEEYSLAGMVCLLQEARARLTKGDAMWCLLMSDLHVGRASVMEIPVLPSPIGSGRSSFSSAEGVVSKEGPVGAVPALCRFHGGWGFGNGGTSEFPMNGMNRFMSCSSEMTLQREIECPKRFNLSPSMKNLLKRNVAMFSAGFRANSKHFPSQSQVSPSLYGNSEESQYARNQDIVNSVVSKFSDLNFDENTEQVSLDQKGEMILNLIPQIKDLQNQVKERKEWAHQKAIQAAKKLSHDLTELKMLRMEREETQQRLKKGKQTIEETTLKRLTEMENALRRASGRVDFANAAVRKLETENAEIKSEIEASKLSASESVTTCLEVAKREKRGLKSLLALEKQKTKMHEDIAAEKQKISDLERELAQVEAATKEAEARWRQEQKAKELVVKQLEEERRLKEASEANNKKKLETLRLKIDIDFQRHKDDLQRLEQETAHLQECEQSKDVESLANDLWTETGVTSLRETITQPHKLDEVEDSHAKEVNCDRKCMICRKYEVSVVFLPCAHQVICVNCNEEYRTKGKAACPFCRVPIEQRIRIYGASS